MTTHLRLRRVRLHSDDGFSLIETLFALSLLGVVLAMLVNSLTTTQKSMETQYARSVSNDQLSLATQAMDREMRSGDLLYDPDQESYPAADIAPGYSMRLFSEANVPSRGDKRCVQYRLTSDGDLERRDWDPEWTDASNPAQVTGWRILATNMRNRAENVPAFTRPQVNLVQIVLLANSRPGTGLISRNSPTVRAQLAISGRNSAIVSDQKQCGPSQPDPSLTTVDGRRVPPYS